MIKFGYDAREKEMKRSSLILGVARVPLDYILALSALISAYFLRAQVILPSIFKQADLLTFPAFEEYIILSHIGAGIFIIIAMMLGSYSFIRPRSIGSELKIVFAAAAIWLMAVISYYYLLRTFPFSRLVPLLAALFLIIFISLGRIFLRVVRRILLRFGIGVRKILIVGSNQSAEKLKQFIQNTRNFILAGMVGTFQEVDHHWRYSSHYDEIFHTHADHNEARELIDFCREHQLEYHFVPNIIQLHRSGFSMITLGGVPLISLNPTPLEGWRKVLKRCFDIIASLLGLILLAPFFFIIGIFITIDSRGTVFFRYLDNGKKATRIGERGKPFHCLKFRTMKMNTHALRYTELADRNLRKGSPLVKIKNDPRITRVGKFLRRYSIDELPSLWNVFIGEMSLVGPRPHLPEEVADYKQHHKFVFTLKPGITGLAQINGRSDLDFEQEVRLDTFYIENWSLWLDIKILFKTLIILARPYRE